jgi:hypothetical protein
VQDVRVPDGVQVIMCVIEKVIVKVMSYCELLKVV